MHDIGIFCDEIPVPGEGGTEHTNDCCNQRDALTYDINGTDISLPVLVNEAAMLMNQFTVSAKRVKALLEGTGFRPVEVFPGKALMQLLAVDYRKNDLGDYNEAAIIFPVLTPGESRPLPLVGPMIRTVKGTLNNFVYRMPVDQNFTTHAGRFIWGFPKWVSTVDINFDEKRASASFEDQGELVFAIESPATGKIAAKPQTAPSLAIRDGRAWRTFGVTEGEGMTVKLGGKAPTIGNTHPLAKLLRELGLPKRPMMSVSMQHVRLRFDGAESVPVGQPFSSTPQ